MKRKRIRPSVIPPKQWKAETQGMSPREKKSYAREEMRNYRAGLRVRNR